MKTPKVTRPVSIRRFRTLTAVSERRARQIKVLRTDLKRARSIIARLGIEFNKHKRGVIKKDAANIATHGVARPSRRKDYATCPGCGHVFRLPLGAFIETGDGSGAESQTDVLKGNDL